MNNTKLNPYQEESLVGIMIASVPHDKGLVKKLHNALYDAFYLHQQTALVREDLKATGELTARVRFC